MAYMSKVPLHQQMYSKMLALGEDRGSVLFQGGMQRQAQTQGHLGAFWDGYNRVTASRHVIPGTLSEACAAAGTELRARDELSGSLVPRACCGMSNSGQGHQSQIGA